MNKKFILFINSTETEPRVTLFEFGSPKEISSVVISDKNQLSEQLLIEVEKLLLGQNIKKSDLVAIVGHIGPGSYTGVRIGITTANFLAFSLNIPVFSTDKEKLSKQYFTEIKGKLLLSDRFTLPILPVYKAPPFITKKKV